MTRRFLRPVAAAAMAVAALWPLDADAQRRRVVHPHGRSVVIIGGYYYPYYSPWFYDPWFAWGQPFPWYPPYGRLFIELASLRLQVEPKYTEVFVDGYFAGAVDDFDGVFQRLRLEPGEHELTLYLPGHRVFRQRLYLQPGATFRVRHTMEPLAPGEPEEPRPSAPPLQPGPPRLAPGPVPPTPPGAQAPAAGGPVVQGAFGTLAIRVQPGGARVLIDGETWEGPAAGERLVVELPEGDHRIEIRRDGFTPYITTVRVRRGETSALNVSLARE